jgi:hypothetical protein
MIFYIGYHVSSFLLMVGLDYLVEKLACDKHFKNIFEYCARTTIDDLAHMCNLS